MSKNRLRTKPFTTFPTTNDKPASRNESILLNRNCSIEIECLRRRACTTLKRDSHPVVLDRDTLPRGKDWSDLARASQMRAVRQACWREAYATGDIPALRINPKQADSESLIRGEVDKNDHDVPLFDGLEMQRGLRGDVRRDHLQIDIVKCPDTGDGLIHVRSKRGKNNILKHVTTGMEAQAHGLKEPFRSCIDRGRGLAALERRAHYCRRYTQCRLPGYDCDEVAPKDRRVGARHCISSGDPCVGKED